MEKNIILKNDGTGKSIDGVMISSTQKGYEVTAKDRTIFFPNAELLNYGCRNCVWKIHGQCPHAEQKKEEGICNEVIEFLSSLADKTGELNSVWENFHIYKARLQEMDDYKDFKRLEKEIRELENSSDTDKLDKLMMKKDSAKIWWVKLNTHVIQSMQKIADRSTKSSGGEKLPGIYGAKTVNFNITNENKKIEHKEAKNGNTKN